MDAVRMKKFPYFGVLLSSIIWVSLATANASELRGYAGGLLGAAISSGDAVRSASAGFAAGGSFGAFLDAAWAGDFSVTHASLPTSFSQSLSVTQIRIGADHFVSGEYGDGYGLRIGGFISPVFEAFAGTSETEFGLGPRIGYDYPVHHQLTLGIEGSWTVVLGDLDGYSLFSFLVPVRFWF